MRHLHAAFLLSLSLVVLPLRADQASTAPQAVPPDSQLASDLRAEDAALARIQQGRFIFRRDTFGSEAFWGGALRLHQAIAGQANGGVGPGLSPKAALALGLKVDLGSLPEEVRAGIRQIASRQALAFSKCPRELPPLSTCSATAGHSAAASTSASKRKRVSPMRNSPSDSSENRLDGRPPR